MHCLSATTHHHILSHFSDWIYWKNLANIGSLQCTWIQLTCSQQLEFAVHFRISHRKAIHLEKKNCAILVLLLVYSTLYTAVEQFLKVTAMILTIIAVSAFFCYRCLLDHDDKRCVYTWNHQRRHYKEVAWKWNLKK